ncbi:MAG: sigma-54-dependent Fis family transcriptional regulator [Deltaproteobacteria bacterium]|nr:MAG: sigma-54-dependent Fis family transcriptional regulator [Deltaproteobacteria bacterium]
METILIVDDEKNYPPILAAILEEEGYDTLMANSGHQAMDILRNSDVDLILADLKMPVMGGIELLEHVKTQDADIPVIMMTAHGTVEKAVEAMQKGAYTFIQKPFDNEQLVIFVKKALAVFNLVKENRNLRNTFLRQYGFGNIIGKSKPMRAIFDLIRKVAPSGASILIEGESGTGKELVARSIHFNSPRKEKPFIAVNCAALTETLLESELFGHEKGAFTGAASTRKGRFEVADEGTLFLDEIGELSQNLQVKLLRVLQEKTFERVGGSKPIHSDIRLIAATNKSLKKEVAAHRFRDDLYYRLNVVRIQLPPLRNRTEDIPLLASHFIKKYADERPDGKPVVDIEQAVIRMFYDYAWPGNIRELENIIERAMILCPEQTIRLSDLPLDFQDNASLPLNLEKIPENAKLIDTLTMVEKMMIERSLKLTGNVQARAAELLGIGKSGLSQKIKKFGLEVGSKK